MRFWIIVGLEDELLGADDEWCTRMEGDYRHVPGLNLRFWAGHYNERSS